MSLAGGCLLMILPAARGNKSFLKGEPERHIEQRLIHAPRASLSLSAGPSSIQLSFPQYSWEPYPSKLLTHLFSYLFTH